MRGSPLTPHPHPSQSPSVKPSPNQPCPCGSGKKFKRCCGAAARPAPLSAISSASDPVAPNPVTRGHRLGSTRPLASVTASRWKTIAPKFLRRMLREKECVNLLLRTNPAASELLEAFTQGFSVDTANALLAYLEPVSELEYNRVPILLDMRNMAQHTVEGSSLVDPIFYRHMMHHADAHRWKKCGRSIQDLLLSRRPDVDHILDDLRDVCRRLDAPVPKLILGYELLAREGRRSREAFEVFATAIPAAAWRDGQAFVPRWSHHMGHAVDNVVHVHLAEGRIRDAIDAAQGTLKFPWEQGDIDESSMSLLCQIFFGLGLDSGVAALCRRLSAAHPTWYAPHHWLGCTAAMAGRSADARKHFKASIDGHVDDDARVTAAGMLVEIGEPDVALEMLSVVGNRDTRRCMELKAAALAGSERPDEALATYERLSEQDPENLDYRLRIAALHELAQRLDSSRARVPGMPRRRLLTRVRARTVGVGQAALSHWAHR